MIREEIREGIELACRCGNCQGGYIMFQGKRSRKCYQCYKGYKLDVDAILNYLHSQGVVIKVDRELPALKKKRMKLAKLKKVIDKAMKYAETTDPCVEFWVGKNEYELKGIGQFHIIPDVTIKIIDSKAGYVAVEPLIKEER